MDNTLDSALLEIMALREEIENLKRHTQWQPIETAIETLLEPLSTNTDKAYLVGNYIIYPTCDAFSAWVKSHSTPSTITVELHGQNTIVTTVEIEPLPAPPEKGE